MSGNDLIQYEGETQSAGSAKYSLSFGKEADEMAPVVKNVQTSYEAKNNQAKLNFEVNENAELTVWVKDHKGRVLDTIMDAEEKPAGAHSIVWNVVKVPNRKYTFEIIAEDLSENKSVTTHSVKLK
ncbi:FlgD immunoglobulin-like domain containing protein [Bacillus sp. V5-8f]|uniref:FlgD immunoglobulin-like domain containing protein n=1 Tax=Bacillus sp. V5-8f TaxID=2053044 RepID=UPI000C762D1D|nr:FlgD immunoglobulin-like domain containing protein [Bacillus sp. V5-8f]PLT32765.1 hypothetical protein CUU64_16575 [Bacillus sp. V5-8f]